MERVKVIPPRTQGIRRLLGEVWVSDVNKMIINKNGHCGATTDKVKKWETP